MEQYSWQCYIYLFIYQFLKDHHYSIWKHKASENWENMPLILGLPSYPSTSEVSSDVWINLYKIPSQPSQRANTNKNGFLFQVSCSRRDLQRLTHTSIVCELAFKIKWIVWTWIQIWTWILIYKWIIFLLLLISSYLLLCVPPFLFSYTSHN